MVQEEDGNDVALEDCFKLYIKQGDLDENNKWYVQPLKQTFLRLS